MNNLLPIFIALVFNTFDLLSGIISAIKNKNLTSSKLRDGLFKKVGFIMCYFLAWLLDNYGKTVGFNIDFPTIPVVTLYAVTTEIVSILENIHKINPQILPDKIKNLLHISNGEE